MEEVDLIARVERCVIIITHCFYVQYAMIYDMIFNFTTNIRDFELMDLEAVHRLGGFEQVTNQKLWASLCRDFGIDTRAKTVAAFTMKQEYQEIENRKKKRARGVVGCEEKVGEVEVDSKGIGDEGEKEPNSKRSCVGKDAECEIAKTDEVAQTFANANLRQATALDGAASKQGYDWGIRAVSAAHDSVKSCPASCARQEEEEQQQEQGQQQENHDCKQFDPPEVQSQQQPEQHEHTQSPPLPLPPPGGLPVSTSNISNISSQHVIMPNICPNSAKAQFSSFKSCTTNTSRGCNHEVAIRRTPPLVLTGITDGIGSSISSRFSRGVNVGAGEGRGGNASSAGAADVC